jgi:hypothetical protein
MSPLQKNFVPITDRPKPVLMLNGPHFNTKNVTIPNRAVFVVTIPRKIGTKQLLFRRRLNFKKLVLLNLDMLDSRIKKLHFERHDSPTDHEELTAVRTTSR